MKETLIKLIQQIPYGRVVSYGALAEQINILTDITTSGWMVGRLLSSMSPRERKYDSEYAWRRVINKQGVVSTLKLGEKGITQVDILRDEGVEVVDGKVDMKKYSAPSFPLLIRMEDDHKTLVNGGESFSSFNLENR